MTMPHLSVDGERVAGMSEPDSIILRDILKDCVAVANVEGHTGTDHGEVVVKIRFWKQEGQ